MAATILSSEPWWVLIEYKWQPKTKRMRGEADKEMETIMDVYCCRCRSLASSRRSMHAAQTAGMTPVDITLCVYLCVHCKKEIH